MSVDKKKPKERARLKSILSSRIAMTLTLALTGIVVLAQVARLQEPPLIGLDEIPRYEGRTVTVRGTVTHTAPTSGGGWLLELVEETVRIVVFVPSLGFLPRAGDHIEATGQVELYHGQWELDCEEDMVRLLDRASRGSMTLEDLARAPVAYVGGDLMVTGVITGSNLSDEGRILCLGDPEGQYNLTVIIRAPLIEAVALAGIGDRIVVKGDFQYKVTGFEYILVLEDGDHGLWISESKPG